MTGPLTAPPSCVVTVDGVTLNDGTADQDPAAVVVVTGLRVVWGRGNSLEQPTPATLSFTLLDAGPGSSYQDLVALDAPVEVRGQAIIYPDPTEQTFADPGFESVPVGAAVPAAVRARNAGPVTATAAPVAAGARAARFTPAEGSRAGGAARVIFTPAPLSTDPTSWDTVPRTLTGQRWAYTAAVGTPDPVLGDTTRVRVSPVALTAPTGAPGTWSLLPDTAAPVGAPDPNRYQTYAGTVLPPPGVWLGVLVEANPTGPAWSDVPAGLTWSDLPATPVWADVDALLVDQVNVTAPAAGGGRTAVVFSGRISDLVASYDEGLGGTLVQVTAQDQLAELANREVGSAPWPAQPLGDRFARVVAESGQPISWTVDPAAAGLPVTWRDVDAQPAGSLLTELAASADAVLWAATHAVTGPYLTVASVASRPALLALTMQDGVVVIVVAPAMDTGIVLSACDVLLDPVQWRQDASDVATRVSVQWYEQTVDDDGLPSPTQRTVTHTDAAAELSRGARRVSLSTQLSEQAAADNVATALLGRLSTLTAWRVDGLSWDLQADDRLDPGTLGRVMTLLDGTSRLGLPVLLTELPAWSPVPAASPVPMFVEGGTYTHTDGAWTLDVVTSSAAAQGTAGVIWSALPAEWSWDEFDPGISWADLAGVRYP